MKKNIENIVSLFFATGRIMHEQKEASKSEKSCSHMHLFTLKYIREAMPLMKDLADFLGISPPSATSLVNTLAKNSLVKRETDKNDRRIVRITITSKGEKYLNSHKEKVVEKFSSRLALLSEHEQKQLISILEKINQI